MPEPTSWAYLGGLVDGDGYFKITRNYRTPRIKHPYYANVLGIAQLWPGPAVSLFAATLGGVVKPVPTRHGRLMARCELRGNVAASAARRLLPFLLIKRDQALLFLEAVRRRPTKRGRTLPTEKGHECVERIVQALESVQAGVWGFSSEPLPLDVGVSGLESLTPPELGWSRNETLAYLAGIMDSDGNFRISRRHVPGMRWPQYRINVRCAQVLPSPAVQLLNGTFGGHLTVMRGRRPHHRDLIAWNVHDREAVPVIEELLPHLRVTWIDACLLLELRYLKSCGKEDLTTWVHANRWRGDVKMRKRTYSSVQVTEFERVRRTLMSLHAARGSNPPTVPATQG